MNKPQGKSKEKRERYLTDIKAIEQLKNDMQAKLSASNISYQSLSDNTGVNRTTISMFMSTHGAQSQTLTVLKLCKALAIDPMEYVR